MQLKYILNVLSRESTIVQDIGKFYLDMKRRTRMISEWQYVEVDKKVSLADGPHLVQYALIVIILVNRVLQ
jgi:hypothetical protein